MDLKNNNKKMRLKEKAYCNIISRSPGVMLNIYDYSKDRTFLNKVIPVHGTKL